MRIPICSNETMALVTKELLDKRTGDVQDGWVVMVEDSVTYRY